MMKILSTLSISNLTRKIAWLMVLMVWVGMVVAVVVYQSPEEEVYHANIDFAEENLAKADDIIEETVGDSKVEKEEVAKEVSADDERTSLDFFVEYRVQRDKSRSEQVNLLREMINNPNSDEVIKTQAQERLLEITNNIEKEMEIESLIRAQGYKDGIALVRKDSVDIIVASDGLTKEDAAKIGNIVANNTGIGAENVTIVEKAP